MANIQIKNAANVAKYRADIEKAAGRALMPEDASNDQLIGRMFGSDFDYLQSIGLLNRGFCPYCGGSPVDEACYRSNIHNRKVKVYLCKECWENNNPAVQFDRAVAGLDLGVGHEPTPMIYVGFLLLCAILALILWGISFIAPGWLVAGLAACCLPGLIFTWRNMRR